MADWDDPVIDLAYVRVHMLLVGLPDAAEEFLHTYETEIGRQAENLGFWEIAAGVRPMLDPADWAVDREPGAGLFQ